MLIFYCKQKCSTFKNLNCLGLFKGCKYSNETMWNGIGDEGAKNITQTLTINTLTINNTLTTLDLTVRFVYFWTTKANAELIEIQHSKDKKIGVEGAKELAEALKTNNTLTTLDLTVRFVYFLSNLEINDFIEIQHSQGNKIRDEGAKELTEALKTNNTLTYLHLEVRFLHKRKVLLKFNQ